MTQQQPRQPDLTPPTPTEHGGQGATAVPPGPDAPASDQQIADAEIPQATAVRGPSDRSSRTAISPRPSAFAALARLVRLPNLFTAIPDAWAGAFLATAIVHGTAVGATVSGAEGGGSDGVTRVLGLPVELLLLTAALGFLAYLGGVVLNDVVDLAHDREMRPERPLPSGRIPLGVGWLLVVLPLTAVIGLAFARAPEAGWTAVALVGAIVAYDLIHKRLPQLGLPLMGLSRALNVALGMVVAVPMVATDPALLGGALALPIVLFVWVMGISFVARLERTYAWADRLVPRMILAIAVLDATAVAIVTGNPWATLLTVVWLLPAAGLARVIRMS